MKNFFLGICLFTLHASAFAQNSSIPTTIPPQTRGNDDNDWREKQQEKVDAEHRQDWRLEENRQAVKREDVRLQDQRLERARADSRLEDYRAEERREEEEREDRLRNR